MHFSLWPKLCQTIVSLICTAIFLDHVHEEIMWVSHNEYHHDDDYVDDDDADHTADHEGHSDDYADLADDYTDDHSDDHHDDFHEEHHDDHTKWSELRSNFLHDLWDLYYLVSVLLAFTIVVMVSVFYSICKHFGGITLDQHITPDMYDDAEKEHERRASEAGDNRFLQRNLEMAHNPIQLPPNGGRLSITQQSPEFYGSQDFGAPPPEHPYGLQVSRSSTPCRPP